MHDLPGEEYNAPCVGLHRIVMDVLYVLFPVDCRSNKYPFFISDKVKGLGETANTMYLLLDGLTGQKRITFTRITCAMGPSAVVNVHRALKVE